MRRWLRQLSLARLHLLVAAPTMALLVVLVPPIQSPDETLHVCRAGAVSRGAIMTVVDEHGLVGSYVDEGLWWLPPYFLDIFNGRHGTMSWERFERAHNVRWLGSLKFCEIHGLNYGPVGYAPQALGLLVGRLLGISVLMSYYLARLFVATTALALGNAALRLITCGRLLTFVVLMLPMTLFLGASISQDALQIPGTVLAIALATRLLPGRGERPTEGPWRLVALTAAMASGRSTVAPLALLALTPPPPGERGQRRRAWAHRAGAVVACVVVLVAWFSAIAPNYRDRRREAHADPARQGELLRAQPTRFASVVTTSLRVSGGKWARQTVGVLGWLDTPLPDPFYRLAWALLLAAIFLDPFRRAPVTLAMRALYLAVFLLSFTGILLALYLVWSDVGAVNVGSAQGRYFVPLIPLLGVALGVGVDGRPCLPRVATTAAALFAVIAAGVTVTAVVQRYYP
jgi:uncharacterized membrane protein